MKGIVTISDDNRILIMMDGDWRLPQQIMRCLNEAAPGLAQATTIHLTSRDGRDQPSISLEVMGDELAVQFKHPIQMVRARKEANIIQTAQLA